MRLTDWIGARCFDFVHRHQLVYNTCWEDPRVDRPALDLRGDDVLLTITSAGCNVLDYALQGAGKIVAVDLNPRQNALLELKIAAIRQLDFEPFFQLFGRGRLTDCAAIYEHKLRWALSPSARRYWDGHLDFFEGTERRPSFYFRGTTGCFAWLVNRYIDSIDGLRERLEELFAAQSVDEQRRIYEDHAVHTAVWRPYLRWLLRRDSTLSMLGVPRPQRAQLDTSYVGGIARFIEDMTRYVFTCLPLHDNYFWRVYFTGQYTPECCPEYLRRENFERLKAGLVDRIEIHTCSVARYLQSGEQPITRFVLLDHMDWLSARRIDWLQEEWQAIMRRAAPQARLLWRSAGHGSEFVDRLEVAVGERAVRVGELLKYQATWRPSSTGSTGSTPTAAFSSPTWQCRLLGARGRLRRPAGAIGFGPHESLGPGNSDQEEHRGRMSLASDLRVLWHLAVSPIRGETHAERLDSFYGAQVRDYDAFRARLLPGRPELLAALAAPPGGRWLDLGGGTGWNVECLSPRLATLSDFYLVDLSEAMLGLARERIARHGWRNVHACRADATTFEPPGGPVDVVTFSYSLTMIPDWFAALENAWQRLRPGGRIGVVDFYVARKHAVAPRHQHGWLTRTFWPAWFARDNVYLSPDHLPYLLSRFETELLVEGKAKVPYVPLGRVPYYVFVGKKPA